MRWLLCILALTAIASGQTRTIDVDVAQARGPHSRTPLNTVGAGRANEGLRADWQAQLAVVQREIGFRSLRFHGILHDDMAVYSEDAHGNPVYNFEYVDVLYDALLEQHIRPFVELSFMPSKLASGPQTIFWWKGNITPPKDMEKWNALIRAFVQHLLDRYGEEEVRQWYFEVWNEPDLHNLFFTGSQEDYFRLYRNTAESVRSVCPRCKVGGPASAVGWEADWLRFLAREHVPADFLSTHTYGVKQGALDPDGHATTVLDPSPDAIVGRVKKSREMIGASATPGLELHYTEWSSSYTPTDPLHDQYEEASYILEKLRATAPLAQSMSYWTFTDIFEELGPPMRPFYGGFGLLTTQGIRKPAFFAYKFLAQLGSTDVASDDAHSWVTKNQDGSVQALFWDYTPVTPPAGQSDQTFFKEKRPAQETAPVELTLNHIQDGTYRVAVYRTGYRKNDAYTAYLEMGAPDQLSRAQVDALQRAANGAALEERAVHVTGHRFQETFAMQENDTVLVTLVPVH